MQRICSMCDRASAAVLCLFAGIAISAAADGTYEGSWAGLSGVVDIPSGVVAPVTDADLADFANVTSIVFADSTSGVSASGLAGKLVLNAALSGAGTFTVENCAAGFDIMSDNSGLDSPGRFVVTTTRIDVYSRYGLGDTGTGVSSVSPSSASGTSTIRFHGPNDGGSADALRFEAKIEYLGNLSIGAATETDELIVDAGASVRRTNKTTSSGEAKLTMASFARIVNGVAGNISGANHVWFYNDKTTTVECASGLYAAAGAYLYSGTIALNVAGALKASAVRIFGGTPTCNVDGAFSGSPTLEMATGNSVELNGHTLTIGNFNPNSGNVCEHGNSTKPGPCYVKSAAPGGVLVQTAADGSSHNPKFTGHASYKLSASGKSHTFRTKDASTIVRSTSVGSLTVAAGTLTLAYGWGWGGTNVTVTGSAASLVCNSAVSIDSAQATAGGVLDISRATALVVTNGASLTIASGVVLTVSSACLGNARLPEGVTMTTDEINAAYGDQLGGCTIAGGGAIHTLGASAWHGWTGDTIVVPDGMTVSLLDEDVDAAMAATSIVVNAGARVNVATTNRTLVLSADVSGHGVFSFNACAPVVLACDSSGLLAPGHYEFTDTKVTVRNPRGLGGSDTGRAKLSIPKSVNKETTNTSTGAAGLLLFGGGGKAITNDVPIDLVGTWVFGAETADDVFVQNADFLSATPLKIEYWYFTNEVRLIGGRFGATDGRTQINRVGSKDYATVVESGCTLTSTSTTLIFGGVYHLGGASTPIGIQAHFGNAVKFIMTRENSFSTSTYFTPYSGTSGYLDLNGYSQTISHWGHYGTEATSATTGTDIKSATPATLTIRRTSAGVNRGNIPIRFRGETAARFDTTDSYNITGGASDTKGPLTIDSGAITFKWNAGWTVATNVYLNGGSLTIDSTAAARPLSSEATLTIGEGARLIVTNGFDIVVKRVQYAGEWLNAGKYGGSAALTAGTIDSAHVIDAVFGTEFAGTLTVRRGAPDQGTLLLVR